MTDSNSAVPLCVDLDETVLRTDMFFETLVAAANQRPLLFFQTIFRVLTRGRAYAKHVLAKEVAVDFEHLPVHANVVDFLREEREKGRRVILVTASDQALAEKVVARLEVFDEVVGSNGVENLKGKTKARYLVERFGKGKFDYVGDSKADFYVWREAAGGGIVTASDSFAKKAESVGNPLRRFDVVDSRVKTLLKALRVHQWVKNILLFVPLLLAHKFFSPLLLAQVTASFVAFSLCASSVYLINDLFDLDADRRHRTKKFRPFASGALRLQNAFVIIPACLFGSIVIAALLPLKFAATIAVYFIITLAYSLRLKQIALVDVLLLAGLYSLRLMAGASATGVPISQWLIAFAMFFFFSLACVKRYSELLWLRSSNQTSIARRGYRASDLEQIGTFGASSGYLAILVLALYVNSVDVATLYRHPEVLWSLCPVLLYWVSRVWLLASRGEMHEDPILFALTDKVSYLVGAFAVLIVLIAI